MTAPRPGAGPRPRAGSSSSVPPYALGSASTPKTALQPTEEHLRRPTDTARRPTRRRGWPTAVTAVALLVAAVVGVLGVVAVPASAATPGAASAAHFSGRAAAGPRTGSPDRGVIPASASAAPGGRVVVIGVPGLQWDDLDPARTPHLWGLATSGGTASLSTRTVPPEGSPATCPSAGWLTLSAGQRAQSGDTSDIHGMVQLFSRASRTCSSSPTPAVAADGSATIPGWPELAGIQRSNDFRARIGLLGQAITAAGGKVAAIGPGAALAAADESGKVQKYAASVDALADFTPYTAVFAEAGEIARAQTAAAADGMGRATPADATNSTTTAGETGTTATAGGANTTAAGGGDRGELGQDARRAAVAAVDRTVGEVLAHVPPGSTVLVAGLSDSGHAAHLHVAIATGPAGTGPGGAPERYRQGRLTATSTRQDALVTLTDLTATVTHVLGIPTPNGVVGRAWQNGGDGPATTRDAVMELSDADLATRVLGQVREPFYAVLLMAQLLFYVLAAIVIRRHRRMLTVTQVVATVSGAVPVSAFLAQLVPWWSFTHPMAALLLTIVCLAGLIAGLGFAGPWRRHVLGPLAVVAGVTSLALLLDVASGSHLQVNAVSGYDPVAGGRFYGFANMAFAAYSTGTILLLAGVARLLRHHRRSAVAVCLAYGILAIFADGWPSWGADFGGVPSFVVGLAVFLLMLTGRRISVVRLAAVGLGGAVLVGSIAVADWLRPADQRTHLGAFVQQVIDGEGALVITRKMDGMLHTLGNWWLTLLSLAALAFLFLVLSRPSRWGASALSLAYERAPELRAGLSGALAAALVGFMINDSGIAIPAMALTVAVPLTLAASVRALQLAPPPTTASRPSAPAGTTGPPAT